MAVDFNKIKDQIERLSGQNKQRRSDLWGPPENERSTVRIIPWPDGNNGDPFKERWFYYGIGKGRGIVCPFQFDKPDPINEFRNKVREEGTKESYELANKFKPTRRFYAPVIVRGLEEEGPKLWPFSKTVAKALYDEMMEEDVGDITDVMTGYDVKVTKEKGDKQQYPSTTVKTVRTSSPLCTPASDTKAAKLVAQKQMDEWLESVPDIDEIFPQSTYEEIEKRMNDYLNGDDQEESEGTEVDTKSNGRADVDDKVTEKEFSTVESVFDELEDMVEAEG